MESGQVVRGQGAGGDGMEMVGIREVNMLRFIVKREVFDEHSGQKSSGFRTIDIDVPELQAALTHGGFGESGYDETSLVGVEILRIPDSAIDDLRPEFEAKRA